MNQEQQEKLRHLAGIIRRMPVKDARWILTDLESDLQFNREFLKYLAKHSFQPNELFDLLSPEEFKSLFSKVPVPELQKLMSENPEKKNLFETALGKTKVSDILSKKLSAGEEDNYSEVILEELCRQVSQGKVPYNGISLYLNPPECRPASPAKKSGNCFFAVLNPAVREGDGLKIMIAAPEYSGQVLRISLQSSGPRYFSKESWFINLPIGSGGIYIGEVFPDRIPGPVTVWLEIPGSGEVCRTVYFTGAKSLYTFDVKEIQSNYDSFEVSGNLIFRGKKPAADSVRAIAYCSRCGSPVGTGNFPVKEDSVKMKFAVDDHIRSHKHDYALHLFYGESQCISVMNIFEENAQEAAFEELPERTCGEEIKFDLKADEGEMLFYHISDTKEEDRRTRQILQRGNLALSGAADKNFNRKASPLEISFSAGELAMLSDPMQGPEIRMVWSYDPERGHIYKPYKWENISDLYISFYRRTEAGRIQPMASYVSRLKKEPCLYLYLPDHIGKGEELELEAGYFTDRLSKLICRNGTVQEKEIQGKGIYTFHYKYGQETEIQLFSGASEIRKKVEIPEQKFKIVSFSYLPPETKVSDNGTVFSLYKSPSQLSDVILQEFLLKYPWGCGEQTAAKLVGFSNLLLKVIPVSADHFLVQKIKSGIKALEAYRNESGFYSIFPGAPADEKTTTYIYNNLKLLFPHRAVLEPLLPELWKSIDQMKSKISKAEEGEGRSEIPGPLNTHNEKSILKALKTSVIFEKGKLKNKSFSAYQTLASKVFAASNLLLEKSKNEIEVLAGTEKKVKEIHSDGIRGIAESIGLLDKKKQEITVSKTVRLSDPMDLLLSAGEIVFLEGSFPSTIEQMSFLVFLDTLKTKMNEYHFLKNGKSFSPEEGDEYKDIIIKSSYTFAKKTV
ncbi:MAG TPA: hypothetical protein PKV80_22180, partial [Leptospiraceae bacterium]|nr:hypothetical protein [Leptospiraceae bacterium]